MARLSQNGHGYIEAKLCTKKTRMKAFEEIYQIYKRLHFFESNLKAKKSASSKRHPGEKHNPGEETSRPRECSEA